MAKLTHVDGRGRASMVDVGRKEASARVAVARGRLSMNREAYEALAENRLAKGDALAVARLAGVQAAKRTADWIPLCHSVPLDDLQLKIELDEQAQQAIVTATASARWFTGVEMEALVAVSAACLALYDMAKAVDRAMTIGEIQLLRKTGGRSGEWNRAS